jgi:glucose/arabinose dehydrogenase
MAHPVAPTSPNRAMRTIVAIAMLLAIATIAAGCGGSDDSSGTEEETTPRESQDRADGAAAPEIALRTVARFDSPVHAVAVPGTDLVAVVEQGGRIVVAEGLTCRAASGCPDEPVTTGETVVDLQGEVTRGSEQGLLGLAFHPEWPTDDRIFLNYTDRSGGTRVEAWSLPAPTSSATRRTELLRIRQPYANHNGGHLAFGPDGLLYVGTGDGGDAGDPEDRAQEDDELLGKLLRLDVNGGGERGYDIPAGNQRSGAPEVWALGLRNPWRYSFDSDTGDLWIGDVGQNAWEEIDAIPAERLTDDSAATPNLGWRRFEGYEEFDASGQSGSGELVEPVLAYGRDDGCSVTGGVVYRGEAIESLRGWYVFGDFCADRLRVLDANGVPGGEYGPGDLAWTESARASRVASIAEVQDGALLVVSLDGAISQVVEA